MAELDIYDTGRVPGSRGALRYDEEGVPAGRADLIRGGRLVGRLHSRETAGVMGEGADRQRPRDQLPLSSDRPDAEHLHRARQRQPGRRFRGIAVASTASIAGRQTSMEMFTFSAGLAYLIEDGEPGELLRDVTLTGNTFKTLKDIEAIEDTMTPAESGGGCGKAGQGPLPWASAPPISGSAR